MECEYVERASKVDSPSHYCHGSIECIDAIKSALTPEEFRGHVKATMIQYIWRERWKNGDEDLEKAVKFYSFLKDVK
jgi:hypothetical protein